MAITKEHIRFSIHFAFHLKKNTAEATAMICAAYGENAVSHTTCKRWYQKFRQGDFSLEDEPRAGRPQKIETDELQALLDINSAQTEKELAEQLGVTQQTISVRLHTMGKVQKEGFRMNCPKTTKIVGVTLHSLCFQSSGKKIFCTKSLQAMKSGFFMITLNVENHGLILVNLQHRRQSPISTPRRFCSLSGGIGKVCCITNCYNRVKQSRQTTTNNN
ncbi:hypothetical protein P5V15_001514 [Pogonomyrmex californicus]